jgi:hypothetical protein
MESSSGDSIMRGPVLGRATCQTRLRQSLLPQHEVSDCTHFRIAYYTAAAVVSTKIVPQRELQIMPLAPGSAPIERYRDDMGRV